MVQRVCGLWIVRVAFLGLGMLGLATSMCAQTVQDAIKQIDEEKFAEARQTLNTLITTKARPEYYYFLGKSYIESAAVQEDKALAEKDLAEAQKAYELGIGRNKNYARNYAGLAKVQMRLGKKPEGAQSIAQALELGPNDVENLITLSEALFVEGSRKSLEDANLYLKKAETIDQKNPEIYLAIGELNYLLNYEEIPLSNYQKALALNPQLAQAMYRTGEYHIKYKQYVEGATALKKAVELDPNYAKSYSLLGEVYYRAGNAAKENATRDNYYRLAKENYKKYVTLKGNDFSARYRYAQFLYLSKEYENAITEINLVLKENPSNVMLRLLAYSQFELSRVEEAKQTLFKYFLSINPKYVVYRDYEYRGKITMKEGRLDEAKEDLLKAFELEPSRTDIIVDLVRAYTASKQYAKAIEVHKVLVNADPKSINNYYTLGKLYYFEGSRYAISKAEKAKNKDLMGAKEDSLRARDQFLQSDVAFKKVVELRPSFLTGYLELARTNSQLDPETELGLAKPHYEKLIELTGGDEVKYKKELAEAYYYLSYYSYNVAKDNKAAMDYVSKTLRLDPEFTQAKSLVTYLQQATKGGQ